MAGLMKRWPVVEMFGPTVQGEGVDQGVVAHFVRFGGCDFRCTWCDTPHAVLPAEVRENAERLTAAKIIDHICHLSDAPWIILTGGNPALHDLQDLVDGLHDAGYLVAVETQGTRWREWMRDVDRLCVSPKGPSSKQTYKYGELQRFMEQALRARGPRAHDWLFTKVVCFDRHDLDFAESLYLQSTGAHVRMYLSAGNDAGRTVGHPARVDDRTTAEVRADLLLQALWLTEEVFKRPDLCKPDVVVQAQFHVALWGNEIGR